MAEQDGVLALAMESARRVLARHDQAPWLQLVVRIAYAYEEMTATVQPAHSRAFFAQSNPEVLVRLLSAWLDSGPDLENPGLASALAELRERLDAGPEATTPTADLDPSKMLDGALTSGELSERLGVTRQAVNQRRSRGQILGFKRGREFLYPRWQLGSDGALLEGLPVVLEALGDGPAEVHARFLLSPLESLSGAAPLQLIREGRIGEVVTAIRGL
jgi:hypothetical protein